MIWIRRLFAVIFGMLFIPLFVIILVVLRVNGTLLEPQFYVEQLRKADLFNFSYDTVIPVAIDESAEDSEDFPVDVAVVKEDVTAFAREVLPPQWLQGQVEQVITQVLPYMLGATDEFEVRVPLSERVTALGEALKDDARQERVYRLVFDGVITPAIEKQLAETEVPLGLTVAADELVAAIQAVAQQDWLHQQVTLAVDALLPYLTGEAEQFEVRFVVADRLVAFKEEAKQLLESSGIYTVVSNPEFAQEVDERLAAFGELPFGVVITSEQIVPTLERIVPPSWLQPQVDGALDQIVAYLISDGETVLLRVELQEPVRAALEGEQAALKVLLRDIGAYDKVYQEGVVPRVLELAAGLGGGEGASNPDAPVVSLPLAPGVELTITLQEMRQIVGEALGGVSPEFLRAQVEGAIDGVVPYLVGDAAHFSVTLAVGDLVDQVLPALEQLLDARVTETFESLPLCTVEQALELVATGLGSELPGCRPGGFTLAEVQQALGAPPVPALSREQLEGLCGCDLTLALEGVSLEELLSLAGIDFGEQLTQVVQQVVPQDYTFTDADLRRILGQDNEKLLDNALTWIADGFTFTEADLRERVGPESQGTLDDVLQWTRQGFTYSDADLQEDLGPQNLETLTDVLGWLRDGYVFTHVDLEKAMADLEGGTSLGDVDTVRHTVNQVRSVAFLIYLVPFLPLTVVGFAGGRRWRGRLKWAAAFLAMAAAIVFVAAGPAYQLAVEPRVDEVIDEALADAEGIQRVSIEKVAEVAETVASDFLGGLTRSALVFLAAAVVVFAATIFWPRGGKAPQPEAAAAAEERPDEEPREGQS